MIWYLHFYKTYDHQIWQEGISKGFHSNEANQAGAGDVITSRLRNKLKNSNLPFDHVVLRDHVTN